MDVRMPEMDGLEATRTIKAEQPGISVLIITTYENSDYLLEAMKAGAAGYVLKDAPNKVLVDAIRRTLEDESPVNQELAAQLIQRVAGEAQRLTAALPVTEGSGAPTPGPALPSDLTRREAEVLELVARGKTNNEIAASLFISKATAKVHVHCIIRKLRVSDRTQAVVRAFELGLVPPPDRSSGSEDPSTQPPCR